MKTVVLLVVVLNGIHATLIDDHMGYDDIQSYSNHTCKRPCLDDEPAMVCEYDFLVEHYRTLTTPCYDCPFTKEDCYRPHCVATDGSSRGIISVNRMIPGPGIQVCEGDTIRVRVHNKLELNEAVTIHWHGVHQRGSPHMDGTDMVTQCPIPPRTSFTYTFNASTPGTHLWHAHSGLVSAYGMYGHLVIRQPPSKELHINRYDFDLPEHALLVTNWWSQDYDPTFIIHPPKTMTFYTESVLVNGRGMLQIFHDPETGQNVTTPLEEFMVTKGYKYRMRMVSTGIDCPIRLSIDDHVITVIASDGAPVEPMEVESVTILDGERYDFILDANQSISNYLMRFMGLGDCSHVNAKEISILKYEGASDYMDLNTPAPELKGKELNPYNTAQSNTKIPVTELRSLEEDDPAVTRQPDRKIVVGMDFHYVNNPRFHNKQYYPIEKITNIDQIVPTVQMNNITLMMPPAPLLTQFHDIPEDMFCNRETLPKDKDCDDDYCECVHLYQVALGDVVEVILVDEGRIDESSHPTHLHGHLFRVMAMEKLGNSTWTSTVEQMDKAGNITRNLDRPPKKDAVAIPDGGYTVIRFHANNPGFWLFHCHLVEHLEIGMGLVFQVGNVSEFPRRPAGFPRCGSWDAYEDTDDGIEEKKNEEDDEEKEELRERIKSLEKILNQKEMAECEGHKVCSGVLTSILCLVLIYIL